MGEVLGVSPQVCRSRWADLTAELAHGLARLRVDVLVHETGHPRPELDEADLALSTEHLWVPDGDLPAAYLRVVHGEDGVRVVDRACARADLRRLGLTSALLVDVVARYGAAPLRAYACRDTVAFFTRQGFEVRGDLVAVTGGPRLLMYRHPDAPWRE